MGLPPEHEQSYSHYMWSTLFDHMNVNPSQVNIPHGMTNDVDAHCRWHRPADPGHRGPRHIAFNEPGSSLGSRTRIKTLPGPS
jgi:glucosamine-6-phosphate deaminase